MQTSNPKEFLFICSKCVHNKRARKYIFTSVAQLLKKEVNKMCSDDTVAQQFLRHYKFSSFVQELVYKVPTLSFFLKSLWK